MTSDWSQLPNELLLIVAKKLPDLPDFVRFRAVCSRWHSSVLPSDHPPYLPWILRRDIIDDDFKTDTISFSFYSLVSNAVYSFRISSPVTEICPCGDRLLLFNDDVCTTKLVLFNPITASQHQLPAAPFSTLLGNECPGLASICGGRAYTIRNQSFDDDSHYYAFLPPGDDDWSMFDGLMSILCNPSCYGGKVFLVWDDNYIDVHNADVDVEDLLEEDDRPMPISILSLPESVTNMNACGVKCIMSSSHLLCVALYGGFDENEHCIIKVYRLELDEKKRPSWVRTRTIGSGDELLVLTFNDAFHLEANIIAGLNVGRNLIYCMVTEWEGGGCYNVEKSVVKCLFKYCLEDDHTERLSCPWSDGYGWFMPSLK